jgi:hypothetical protein
MRFLVNAELHHDFKLEASFHDAAYDAYITGTSFIRMFADLAKQERVDFSNVSLNNMIIKESSLLKRCANKLFLMQSLYEGFFLKGKESKVFK